MGVAVRGGDVHRVDVRNGVDLRPHHRLLPRRPRHLHPLEVSNKIIGNDEHVNDSEYKW